MSRLPSDDIWHGEYKIPWHDPDFSRRMLAEHLSQHHDLASRRTEWIEKQVEWIHTDLLDKQPARILDLGCGPGFYSSRLAILGHRCRGIDFGPASIEYARQHCPARAHCEFILGDLRHVAFGGPYDLAMLLYGEMNVFSPAEILAILRKVRESLAPRSGLILEAHTTEAVEHIGRGEPAEQEFESGLFSDRPHRCRTENRWLPEQKVAIQTFSITETPGGPTRTYCNTTIAWPDDALTTLLTNAGFHETTRREEWPCNTDDLTLWITTRG